AHDYKVVEALVSAPGREHWRDLVAHEPGRMIRRLLLFKDYLVRLERVHALPRIVIRSLAGGEEYAIDFDEAAYDLGIRRGYEYTTTTLRFTYSSLTTPQRTFDFDMATRRRVLRKQQVIPSGHDPERYVAQRLDALGHDGVGIPVSVLRRRDTPVDGSAPLLLYGYGAYGMSIPAAFSANRFSLVDRGFIYAVAHVRGGTDRGFQWYRHGKLEHKTNTFADFIAAAETLIERQYTRAGRIVAHGASAGGLLVGAVMNMRPDLFGAAVGEVPFVDVLNTMSDDTLPLTPPEWVEWGNPVADPQAYRRMKRYSPYDNVAARDYPPILATAGIADPRVTYWEPAKWVAKLRALKTGDHPVLLHTNMDAGHGGAAGRSDRLGEVALVYAFMVMALGGAEHGG
ncbi:MAG: prolyl oligopeptidase family serine peptidase, partial [Rhodospirillaceae bacterium]|nr:prolyl oligopeptidase family serine peptidase [Rhodospirillaceae bacterium]